MTTVKSEDQFSQMSSSGALNDDPSTTGLQSHLLTTEATKLSAITTMEPESRFSQASKSNASTTIAQTTAKMIAEEFPQKGASQNLGKFAFLS